jgi:uncharacterized protein
MSLTEVLVAGAILVGLVGILVPVLPGTILVVGAVLVWAWATGGATAWLVFAVATTLIAVGTVVKFLVPGRRLQDAGIPASTQWFGVAAGVVGFFVVPVVGLVLGFVLGVYLAERARLGAHGAAWPSTVHALKAAGWSMLIELATALIMAATWGVGVALG